MGWRTTVSSPPSVPCTNQINHCYPSVLHLFLSMSSNTMSIPSMLQKNEWHPPQQCITACLLFLRSQSAYTLLYLKYTNNPWGPTEGSFGGEVMPKCKYSQYQDLRAVVFVPSLVAALLLALWSLGEIGCTQKTLPYVLGCFAGSDFEQKVQINSNKNYQWYYKEDKDHGMKRLILPWG